MAATAHLTLGAPDNEKFTVPIGAKQIAQAQSLLTSLRSGDGSNYNWPAPNFSAPLRTSASHITACAFEVN